MSMVKFYPGPGQPRVQLDGAIEKRDGLLLIRFGELFNLLGPEQIVVIGIQVFRPFTFGCSPPGFLNESHSAAEAVGDLLCDFGLNGEDVLSGPVPILRPKMVAGFCIDQLCCDPYPAPLPLDRAFQYKADME